jgi:ABC-type uncharacterized transport system substrate-binding protein
MMRWLAVLATLVLGVSLAAPAEAHPHVFIVAKTEVVFAPDGTMTGVRHHWTFDDMFSSMAVQGIDTKTKGVFTRDELKPLAQTNVESLKEYDFFTFAKQDGKKLTFKEPVDYFLDHDPKDGALTLHFTLPLRTPVKLGTLDLEIFDPSYFIDFTFAEKDPVALTGAPASCKLDLRRPTEATANQQRLSEQNFADGDNSNYGAMYASKIRVTC